MFLTKFVKDYFPINSWKVFEELKTDTKPERNDSEPILRKIFVGKFWVNNLSLSNYERMKRNLEFRKKHILSNIFL